MSTDAGWPQKQGLIHRIGEHFDIPLVGVPFIGDALRDIQAARAVGATPILVRTGKGLHSLENGEGLDEIHVYDDLAAAVEALLSADTG